MNKIIFIFCFIPLIIFCQEKVNFSVSYKLTYKIDSTNNQFNKENFILFVSKNKSKFESIATFVKDSLMLAPNADKKSITLKYRTPNNYYIINNREKNEISHFQSLMNSNFFYKTNQKLNWNIENETKIFLNLKCRKATIEIFGRRWIAWYSEDYPLPFGPYKFYGLPGLILSIHDSNNHYSFEAYKIIKEDNTLVKLNFESSFTETTKEKFWNTYHESKYNVDYMFKDFKFEDPTIMQTMRKNALEKLKRENNPLELKN